MKQVEFIMLKDFSLELICPCDISVVESVHFDFLVVILHELVLPLLDDCLSLFFSNGMVWFGTLTAAVEGSGGCGSVFGYKGDHK